MMENPANGMSDGWERLSGDYVRGYTKAIQDITEIFEYVQQDLKYHGKRLNGKLSVMLLKTILDNREKIREIKMDYGENDREEGVIRWNHSRKEFEWFYDQLTK